MAFTYTTIADYILHQLVGFETVNALKNNLRYLTEDILGYSAGYFAQIRLGKDASNGGAIRFNGGASKYVFRDPVDAVLNVNGFNLEIASPNRVKGQRSALTFFCNDQSPTTDFYQNRGTNYTGWCATYAGSITGLTFMAHGLNADTYSVRAEARKNGSNVLQTAALSFTAAGQIYEDHVTQARGVDTFVAGDFLDVFFNFTAGGNTILAAAILEVVLDA